MSGATTVAAAGAAIARLARAPLSCEQFQWQAAAELRRLVAFDAICWYLQDPLTWLPSWVVADNPVLADQQRRLHQLGPAAAEISMLAGCGVSTLSRTTHGDLRSSARWRELLGPGGLGDELSAALVVDHACWGMLRLYRDAASSAFSDTDAQTVAALGPLLARRLRRSLCSPTAPTTAPAASENAVDDHDGPATIILDRYLQLIASTPAAQRRLARLPARSPDGREPLPGFVYALAARLTHPRMSDPSRSPTAAAKTAARLRIRSSDGTWLVLHAAPLSDSAALGAGAVAVTIEAAPPTDLRPLLMRAYRLSPREREVAGLVLAGLPNPDVAAALYISRHTVTDHLKTIYAKAAVTNRGDLAAALSGRPPQRPRSQTGSPPPPPRRQ